MQAMASQQATVGASGFFERTGMNTDQQQAMLQQMMAMMQQQPQQQQQQ